MSYENLLPKLYQGDQYALAKLISLVDSDDEYKYELLRNLRNNPNTKSIGITGPPGAGKSTLTQALAEQLLIDNPDTQIAIIAVDPSSPFNQGALLGDRIRMNRLYLNPRVYIRSLASKGSLGGLNPHSLEVLTLVKASTFEYVILETVGVGQSEIDIVGLADITIVVLVPEAGDDIQTMKAGIMEIADILVVNKADRPQSEQMVKNLTLMVHQKGEKKVPVIATEATTGKGIPELALAVEQADNSHHAEKKAWIETQYIWNHIQKQKMKSISKKEIYDFVKNKIDAEEDYNIFKLGDQWIDP